jgi:4-amino-4-deoxy-L-arabinose transferase-like glycosyltransferase
MARAAPACVRFSRDARSSDGRSDAAHLQPVCHFYIGLIAIAVAASIFGLAYAVGMRNADIAPDGHFYFFAAGTVRQGNGIRNVLNGQPTALHPPLWTLVLTLPRWFGQASVFNAQVFSVFIGVATVVVIGLAGRRIGSERVGLIAAALAALYPGFWIYEQALLSETLLLLLVALMTIASYRYLSGPSHVRAASLGLLCGLLALTRAEQILLVPALLVPVILGWRWREIDKSRVLSLGLACTITALVIAPWSLYNVGRIDEPVLLSTGFGTAMIQGNCDRTYYGGSSGSFDLQCLRQYVLTRPRTAGKPHDSDLRRAAVSYTRHHLDRLPIVLLAREGRAWSLYKPVETLKTQAQFPHDPSWPKGLDLLLFWTFLPLAFIGAVALRRRDVSLVPLLAPFAVTIVAVASTYGDARLRAGAEPALVLLASVGIEFVVCYVRQQRRREDQQAGTRRHSFGRSGESCP